MKNKGIKVLALGLTLLVTNLTPVIASARTLQTSQERGLKHLAWSRNTLSWTFNERDDITSSDGWQDHSGLFVTNEGVTKLGGCNNNELFYNFKNQFKAGAIILGQTLGYDQSITDNVHAYWHGAATWKQV